MNGELGYGAEALPSLRTVCPSASRASVYTAPLVTIYGLQALFVILLLLLRVGWDMAFSSATGLLLVDLAAPRGQYGQRQLAGRWSGTSQRRLF